MLKKERYKVMFNIYGQVFTQRITAENPKKACIKVLTPVLKTVKNLRKVECKVIADKGDTYEYEFYVDRLFNHLITLSMRKNGKKII